MQLVYLAFFYLLGSIPVAWLMGKLAGRGDIRQPGQRERRCDERGA